MQSGATTNCKLS